MTCNKITLLIAKGNNIMPTLPSPVLPAGKSFPLERISRLATVWNSMEPGHKTEIKAQKGSLRRTGLLGLPVKIGIQR
jgi:hypothetical protein